MRTFDTEDVRHDTGGMLPVSCDNYYVNFKIVSLRKHPFAAGDVSRNVPSGEERRTNGCFRRLKNCKTDAVAFFRA